jgi:hypothetical protein
MGLDPEEPLEGWKTIAAYLGRSIKTVQRWKDKGLPVHKTALGIIAYRSELDVWRSRTLAEPAGLEEPLIAAAAPIPPSSAEQSRATNESVAATVAIQRILSSRSGRVIIGALALVALVVVVNSVRVNSRFRAPAGKSLTPSIEHFTASFEQLTNDGYPKFGPLLEDRQQLYFTEVINGVTRPVSIALRGGLVSRADLAPVDNGLLLDLLDDKHEFLLRHTNNRGEEWLWTWIPGKAPQPFSAGYPYSGAWISEALVAETSPDNQLRILSPISTEDRFSWPVAIEHLRWSAVHKILRFTAVDRQSEQHSIWQMRGLKGLPEPLPAYPPDAQNGTWSADGRIYAFMANGQTGHDIWMARESTLSTAPSGTKPVRLTRGPMDFSSPSPNAKGTRIYTIGTKMRGELVRYEANSQRFEPYLDGISAYELDTSPDRSAIIYTSYPDRTLWKAKPEGDGRVQLTASPLMVIEPRWSPDGRQISFLGRAPGKPAQIYVISAEGGSPQPISMGGEEPGVPTWSADGHRLVFGELLYRQTPQDMGIRILDLKRNAIRVVPHSQGLWNARWAPDGRLIAALSVDSRKLWLYHVDSGVWETLAVGEGFSSLAWGADSRFISFQAVRRPDGFGDGPPGPAIYRLDLVPRALARLCSLAGFQPPEESWFGIGHDGAPLALRGVLSQEIYSVALDPVATSLRIGTEAKSEHAAVR